MARPPDGQEVIFTGVRTRAGQDLGIYAIKPDGTGLRAIGAISTTEEPETT